MKRKFMFLLLIVTLYQKNVMSYSSKRSPKRSFLDKNSEKTTHLVSSTNFEFKVES